jgi:hypothetical protein
MLQHLLRIIAPNAKWKDRFLSLCDTYRQIDLPSMGFPGDWRSIEPWRVNPAFAIAESVEPKK